MRDPLRPPRGGFLRPFGCGQFIHAYLAGEGPSGSATIDPDRGAPIEDIRSAYKNALLRAHAEDMVAVALEKGIELSVEEVLRRVPYRLTKVRSHSFYRYFHLLKQLVPSCISQRNHFQIHLCNVWLRRRERELLQLSTRMGGDHWRRGGFADGWNARC